MAGSRIKGITVEIDGNVTGLEKALKSVNTTIKTTQSQLKDVERLLKLDPSHTELLSQKQALLKEKIGATKEKLDALKQAQEQAKQQMESGDLGKDKYDALQREIIETEQELQKLAREAAEANTALNKIDSVGKTLENVGGKMTSVGSTLTRTVTAPIVALGTAAVKTTADFDASMSKVAAVSGATGDDLDALREEYPGAELCIVMGTDMFLSFRSWYRWQYMLEECTLAVLSREDFDRREIEDFKAELETENGARVILIPHTPLPMSSTEIREKLRRGLGSEDLPQGVYECIIRNGFYDAKPELSWLRQMVMPYLKENRIAHVSGVESQAVMLAMHWGEDPDTAAIAGILHDITKAMNREKQLKLCKKYDMICDDDELARPSLLHAKTGAEVAKDCFGVSEPVYEAIRWHTTGKPDMSLLEKIIYLADYIEPARGFDGVEELRALGKPFIVVLNVKNPSAPEASRQNRPVPLSVCKYTT